MNTKRLEWKVYICNKTKYASNYGITIMLMFKNFLIKTVGSQTAAQIQRTGLQAQWAQYNKFVREWVKELGF